MRINTHHMLNLKMASLLKYNAIMLRETQSVAVPLTNQHVVPYNPHLLMLLGCHVNVEFCANLPGRIKYIHKYISNGPNNVTIVLSSSGHIDDTHHYQDCHYIFPPEAMW